MKDLPGFCRMVRLEGISFNNAKIFHRPKRDLYQMRMILYQTRINIY